MNSLSPIAWLSNTFALLNSIGTCSGCRLLGFLGSWLELVPGLEGCWLDLPFELGEFRVLEQTETARFRLHMVGVGGDLNPVVHWGVGFRVRV